MSDILDQLGLEAGVENTSVSEDETINAWYIGFNHNDEWSERHWWNLFKNQESISIGYPGVDSDLSKFENAAEIKDEFGVGGQKANQLERFVHEAKTGDIVFAKDGMRGESDDGWTGNGRILAVGVISSGYIHKRAKEWYNELPEECEGSQNRHHRGVNWIVDIEATSQGEFEPDLKIQRGTIFPVEYSELQAQILNSYDLEDDFEQLENMSSKLKRDPQSESEPSVWIEKSKHDSDYKQTSEWGLGRVIWCPQTQKDGSNSVYYENIKKIQQGDIILHLDQSERQFTSVSVAAEEHKQTTCPEGSEWDEDGIQEMGLNRGERPAYKINLVQHQYLAEPIDVDSVLNRNYKSVLDEIRSKENVVYNSNLNLNQGAYLTRAPEELVEIINSIASSGDNPADDKIPDAPEQAAEIARQLENKKQVVFYGPPGTGKTYTAERFAKWWVGQQEGGDAVSGRVATVTFHPSFTYEDFVEGLSAKTGDDGQVAYEVQDGALKRMQAAAMAAYERAVEAGAEPDRYVLIIDEINRGNLAQIFGEVITLLEADKRGSFDVELAHSGETFTLPPNLYVIGTMNTADQSIALVDTALRRRFRFVDFPPDLDVVWDMDDMVAADARSAVTQANEDVSRREQLLGASVLAVETLNERILRAPELGKGKQLGHTYLLGHDSTTDVVDAWRYDILPQLEEYYFGQFDRLRDDLLTETGDRLVQWDAEKIKSFDANALYTALCQLAGIDDPVPLAAAPVEAIADGTGVPRGIEAWRESDKSVEAFRELITSTLDETAHTRADRLLTAGEEIGRLDTGGGDHNVTAQLKTDLIDPGVGLIQINQDGKLKFRLDWLAGRDENELTAEFVDEAASVFDEIDAYSYERRPDPGDDEKEFTVSNIQIADLSEDEMDVLVDGYKKFAQRAEEFQDG